MKRRRRWRNRCLPVTWVGFAIMFVSGGLLFLAQSAKIYENVFLRAKLLLLVLALANVALFHATTLSEYSRVGRRRGAAESRPDRSRRSRSVLGLA